MSILESVPVQIGEVKIGRAGQQLNAILGSCIGIGFLHRDREIYGLAHVLLAPQVGAERKSDGRYVDHAVESLLRMMDIRDDERRRLRVILAGGANMTRPGATNTKGLVGNTNAEAARQFVRSEKLRILHQDTGGENGRRVVIDCTTGEWQINVIPRLKSA